MKRRSKARGFTLVELAASVAVASIALASTAAAVASGAALARTTAETRCAIRASSSLLENIRSTRFDDIASTFNGTTQSMASLAPGTTSDSSGRAAVTVTELSTGSSRWKVLQIDIVTTWKGGAGDATRKFTTWVSDRTTGSTVTTVGY